MRNLSLTNSHSLSWVAFFKTRNMRTIEMIQNTDRTKVAEQLYRHQNPNGTMCTPNSAYISTDNWFKEWVNVETDLEFFDWCLKNKQ